MNDLVADFPKQLQKALLIAQSAQLNKANKSIQNVFISGLGGSGIGGSIVAELISQEITCPISVNKDYFSPAYINENTLAIICTYSGNTEETIQIDIEEANVFKIKYRNMTTEELIDLVKDKRFILAARTAAQELIDERKESLL